MSNSHRPIPGLHRRAVAPGALLGGVSLFVAALWAGCSNAPGTRAADAVADVGRAFDSDVARAFDSGARPKEAGSDDAAPQLDGDTRTDSEAGGPGATPFVTGALVAGGRAYMVVPHPNDPLKLLVATDVAGVQRSADGGDRFVPSNDGLDVAADLIVASVHWSERAGDSGSTAYACMNSGVYRSVDDGRRWDRLADSAGFHCNGNGHFEPRPRQAGRLLLTSGSHLLVGSATNGVGRWDGSSWTPLGLEGAGIQGMALQGTTLYVAVGNSGPANGVHTIPDAVGASGPPSPMTQADAPGAAWDLVAFKGALWVAATGGIHRFDGTSWSAWRPAGTAKDHWSAIASGYEGATPTIYAALQGGRASKTNGSLVGGVWRTAVGAVAWQDLTAPGTKRINCDAQRPLWTDDFNVIGRPQWRPANLSTAHGVLRANFWRRDASSGNWCPTVDGLLVTGATNIAVDPDEPAHVYASTADYGMIHSWSHGVALPGEKGIEKLKHELAGASGNADRSLCVAFDRTAGEIVATTGNRNIGANNDADIVVFPKASFSSRGSIKSNLPDKRIWAVGVNRVASCGAGRIIIAALENGGIWRGVGAKTAWTQVAGGDVLKTVYGEFPHVTLEWRWGSPNAFLYDPDAGAWRSTNCGASWTRISTLKATHPYGGFAAYAAATDTLYLSVTNAKDAGNGVFAIADASTCAATAGSCAHSPALAGAPPRPGAIALDLDGDLWVLGLSGPGQRASLSYRTAAGSWVDRSDEVSTGAALPLRIAVGQAPAGGQHLYVGFKTNAFIRGTK